MKKKCLIVGIPESGKSTYIASLWYSVRTYDKCSLTSDNLPNNTKYLDSLVDGWLTLEELRTSDDISNQIEINLKNKECGDEFTVMVPDFKGETFLQILKGASNTELQKWLNEAESVILMIKDFEFVKFNSIEENQESETNADGNNIDTIDGFSIESMSGASKNLLLLKYLKANMNIKKLIICVTAWDQTDRNGSSKDYFKVGSIGLYQYIVNNFEEVEFYGLSAQGANYPDDKASDEEKKRLKDSLNTNTKMCKRAYVIEGAKKVFDVTLPLKKAIL